MEIKNVGQLIEHLAKKAGIDSTDANLINVLSNAELSKVPIHSDIATGIDNALLSLSQATDNHPAIKSKYHAQAMNAFDARMKAIMDDSGLPEETIDALGAEKSTYKRFELLTAAIKEAAEAKTKTATKEDKSALQAQVDDLLSQVKNAKTEAETKVAAINQERRNDRIAFELKGMLGSVKTVFDDLPPTAKQAALDSLINKALQDKEASFDFDEAGSLMLKGKDDTAVVGANSTKYTPQSFVDEILAQNKVLKVSEQSGTTTQQATPGATRTTVVDASNTAIQGNNQSIARMNNAALEAFNKQVAQA